MKELDINKKNLFIGTLSNTIEKLMGLHHTNMNQLHKNTGVPLTTINRLINEKNLNPTVSSLLPIANFFGVTLNQLMGIDPLDSDVLIGKYSKKRELWTEVPIITWEQAIEWPFTLLSHEMNNALSTDISLGEQAFALTIHETNLEGFFPNSILIIDSSVTPDHGDYVIIVKIGQKRASLKQVLIDDDKIYLRPVNKDFQTQLLDDTYKILGTVVQIRTDRSKEDKIR